MAIKLEKVVETFYQKLEEGKIMGKKCIKCGACQDGCKFNAIYVE